MDAGSGPDDGAPADRARPTEGEPPAAGLTTPVPEVEAGAVVAVGAESEAGADAEGAPDAADDDGAGAVREPEPGPVPAPSWIASTTTFVRDSTESLRDPYVLLGLLLIFSVVTRVIWLDLPKGSTIFDEAYYVNAARVILGLDVPEGGHYADKEKYLDPNTEHPPLGKLLMAGSMSIIGDNGIGWRIPSVIAGMVVLMALFATIRAAGGTAWLALLAVFLTSLDNLSMVHGRIGVLDIMALAPALVASWLALRKRWVLAAIFLALGLLVKLTAIYALGAILLLWLLQVAPGWWAERRIHVRQLGGPVLFAILSISLFVGGLAVLDSRWSEYRGNPFAHIEHMLTYGARLNQPVGTVGICPAADSRPWQWFANDCQIQYLRTDVSVNAGENLVARIARIDFRGAMNELLVGALPIAMLFTVWFAYRRRDGAALWAVTWAAANWLPYGLLGVISNRIMYIYYFLPLVPAVAAAIAILLLRSKLPRFVLWSYLVLYVIGYIAYFPFRVIPD